MALSPKIAATKWTPAAAECYSNGCNCKTCLLPYFLETKCLMKIVVFELIRKFGAPNIEKIEQEYQKGYTKY